MSAPALALATRAGLPEDARLHAFEAGGTDNPYLAYLALGDQFIVTGESASMLTEACATGKPVHVARHLRDRKLQRALMQFFKPENYFAVRDALIQAIRDASSEELTQGKVLD